MAGALLIRALGDTGFDLLDPCQNARDFVQSERTEPSVPPMIGENVGHYRIVDKIGAGGMGDLQDLRGAPLSYAVGTRCGGRSTSCSASWSLVLRPWPRGFTHFPDFS